MAKKVEIVLKKDGAEDITVKCPQKVKLSVMGALFAIRFGLPPADVKPVQKKDALKCIVLFLLIFVACLFFTASMALGVIALAVVLVLNVMYNKNYFFNFIKKRLAEGYTVKNSESQQILKDAGLWNESSSFSSSATSSSKQPKEDVTVQLEKLASLKEKGILNDDEFATQKAKLLGL